MRYTFIIDNNNLGEALGNTREPFKNLFITKEVDSNDEVGYEVKGDAIVIKYLVSDDERTPIRSDLDYLHNGYVKPLPRLFGVVAELHGAKVLMIGSTRFDIDVVVNSPNGDFYTDRTIDGTVRHHQNEGIVFTLKGDKYVAVDKYTVLAIRDTYAHKGAHFMIPEEYVVRFAITGQYIYSPLVHAYRDPIVAHSFNREIPESEWAKLKETLMGLE